MPSLDTISSILIPIKHAGFCDICELTRTTFQHLLREFIRTLSLRSGCATPERQTHDGVSLGRKASVFDSVSGCVFQNKMENSS